MIRLAAAALASASIVMAGSVMAGDGLDRAMGKALFDRMWVQAPSSTAANDGLGPLFNEKSCASCHSGPALAASIRAAPDGTVTARGLAIRLGSAGGAVDPLYGRQIQPRSVGGVAGEGNVAYRLEGEPQRLVAAFTPARGSLAPETSQGVRQAPALRGIGLLARVDEAAVLAVAEAQRQAGKGPAGEPRWLERDGARKLGRFGWKASAASLHDQVAEAFGLDIGMSSPPFPHPHGDCTEAEPDCLGAPDGRSAEFDGEEISDAMLGLIAAYLDGLALPRPPQEGSPGAALFAAAGCAACHVPAMPAKGGATVPVFTDLLLHDMGPALDDGVGEPGIRSSQWRTAPLMALSLRQGPDRRFLHDGRAATLDAAVRYHGGEAAAARARYEALSDDERAQLIRYLESL